MEEKIPAVTIKIPVRWSWNYNGRSDYHWYAGTLPGGQEISVSAATAAQARKKIQAEAQEQIVAALPRQRPENNRRHYIFTTEGTVIVIYFGRHGWTYEQVRADMGWSPVSGGSCGNTYEETVQRAAYHAIQSYGGIKSAVPPLPQAYLDKAVAEYDDYRAGYVKTFGFPPDGSPPVGWVDPRNLPYGSEEQQEAVLLNSVLYAGQVGAAK